MRRATAQSLGFALCLTMAWATAGCAEQGDRALPSPSDRVADSTAPDWTLDLPIGIVTQLQPVPQTHPVALMVEIPKIMKAVAGEHWTPIVVKVMDASGDELGEEHKVIVTLTVQSASGALSGTKSKLAKNGVVVFSDLAHNVAEAVHFSVHASGKYEGSVSGLRVDVVAAEAERLDIELPSRSVKAGTPMATAIAAYDAFGNLADSYSGTVSVHTLAPMSNVPAPVTFGPGANGRVTLPASVVLRKVGTWAIQVTDFRAMNIKTASRSVDVLPDDVAALDIEGAPELVKAGDPFEITVTARDQYGNPVFGHKGTVSVATTDDNGTVPSKQALSQDGSIVGLVVVLRTAGPAEISVTDVEGSVGESGVTVVVMPAEAATVAFTVSPSSGVVDAALVPAPTVAVHDAFGNVATAPTPVTLSVAGGKAILGGSIVAMAVGGTATFTSVSAATEASAVALIATGPGLTAGASSTFDVFAPITESLAKLVTDDTAPESLHLYGRGVTATSRVSGFTSSIADPGALCLDDAGNLYIGQAPVGVSNRPIVRIAADDTVTASAASTYPVGLSVDSDGNVHVAGRSEIRGPVESFDGGADPVWAAIADADLVDLTLDGELMVAYVADSAANAGRVIEVDGITYETRVLMAPGEPTAIAVHPQSHDLYVVTRGSGELYVVDTGTNSGGQGAGNTVTKVDSWAVERVEGIEFHALGSRTMLYAAVETPGDAGISRWDPAQPALGLQPWATGMQATAPVDLVCGGASGSDPLYVSTRDAGILAFTCHERAEGVSETIAVSETGYHIDIAATVPAAINQEPTALAIDPTTGALVVGSGAAGNAAGPISVVSPSGIAVAADVVSDPDGVAVDSNGRVYVGGKDSIWRADSVTVFGDGAEFTHWHATGGNIEDLVIAAGHGDIAYAALLGGQIVRITQDKNASVVITGSPAAGASLAVDTYGDLWALNAAGALTRMDKDTLVSYAVTSFATLAPDYSGHGRMAFSPHDGRLYVATDLTDHTAITRWDPAADTLTEWVLVTDGTPDAAKNEPTGVAWLADEPCMFFSSPFTGHIHRVCECD